MLTNTYRHFLAHPQRMVLWGFRISVTGMLLLCSGLLGRLWIIVNSDAGKPSTQTLDALLPYIPTWWIPESWFGYFLSLMLMLVGLAAYSVGKRVVAMVKTDGGDKPARV